MKRIRMILLVFLVVAGLLSIATSASAQGGTWVSGIMIVNLNTGQPANITVKFYWAEGQPLAGQVALSFDDIIPVGGSKSYYVPSSSKTAGLPANFVGSVVVSSDVAVAATLNTQVPSGSGATPSNLNRVGTASSVSNAYQTMYVPEVMKAYGGWNSYVAIQNTTGTTATVVIHYYNASNGAEVTAAKQTLPIHPFSTLVFHQSDNTNLLSNWVGSAVITGTQALAGICNFYNAGTSVATAAFLSYNAFGAGATILSVPRIVRNYYNYQGGLTIQNIGTSNTDVTINFFINGNTYTKTLTAIVPNSSRVLYMPNITELGSAAGSGSAIITSSGQPIVAIVNEDNRILGQGATYNASLAGTETNVVVFPQVTSRFYGYSSGMQVQIMGSSATTLTMILSMAGHADTIVTAVVQPHQSWSGFAPNMVSYKGFNGSVTVVSDQLIVGIANLSYRADTIPADGWAPNYGDSYANYNGVNK